MPDPKEDFEQFQELAEEIRQLGANMSPQLQVFSAAVTAAERKMAALHQTNKNDLAPVLTAEDRIALLSLHRKIGEAAEMVLAEKPDAELTNKTRKLASLAAKNYRTLHAYDPKKEEKSLPELLEDARAITLSTKDVELEEGMSGVQSERRPLAYIDEKGKKITGVFTAKKTVSYFDDTKKLFEGEANDPANNMSPAAKSMLKGFLDRAVENVDPIYLQNRGKDRPVGANELPQEKLTGLFWGISSSDGIVQKDYLENAFRKAYPELQGQNLSRVFGKGTMQRLARKLKPLANSTGICVDSARIPDGSRIDTRNAAMYGVADLLGVKHLVAKAVPMKLIGPNGEVTEGTFMHKADGMDVKNLPSSALDIREDALNGTNGKGYKDLADLQVLDFICGNVDRHGANLFYKFKDGKFCGVVAIDNDCSLGKCDPTGKVNVNQMVVPKNMKVISRSMFNRVMTMTPEELAFSLRGYALSEKELYFAKERLKKMQNAIEKGTVKVMEDEDFKNLNAKTVKKLFPKQPKTGKVTNLFSQAHRMISTMASQRLEQRNAYRNLETLAAIGEDNRALPGAQQRETETADLLLDEMERVTNRGFWHFHKGTSTEFEEMRKAVSDYKAYQLRIQDKIREAKSEGRKDDVDAPLDAVVSKDDLEDMARLAGTVREKAEKYLEKHPGSTRNSYTKSRKLIAGIAQEFGQTRQTVKEQETETQEKQMKAAETKSKRMQEKQAQGPVISL